MTCHKSKCVLLSHHGKRKEYSRKLSFAHEKSSTMTHKIKFMFSGFNWITAGLKVFRKIKYAFYALHHLNCSSNPFFFWNTIQNIKQTTGGECYRKRCLSADTCVSVSQHLIGFKAQMFRAIERNFVHVFTVSYGATPQLHQNVSKKRWVPNRN